MPTDRASFQVVADAIRNHAGPADISVISAQIEALLDANIEGVAITAPIRISGGTEGMVD
jgi:hypothetical protein